jgi:hypothetical protein
MPRSAELDATLYHLRQGRRALRKLVPTFSRPASTPTATILAGVVAFFRAFALLRWIRNLELTD